MLSYPRFQSLHNCRSTEIQLKIEIIAFFQYEIMAFLCMCKAVEILAKIKSIELELDKEDSELVTHEMDERDVILVPA